MIGIVKLLKENLWVVWLMAISGLIAYIVIREAYVAELELGNSNYKTEKAVAEEQYKTIKKEQEELIEDLKATKDSIAILKKELKNIPKDEEIPTYIPVNPNDPWDAVIRAIELANDSTFFK